MPHPVALPAWQSLVAEHQAQAALLAEGPLLRRWFAEDPGRAARYRVQLGDLLFDYSKQRVRPATIAALLALADQAGVQAEIAAMCRGERINRTEDRAVLHTALREAGAGPIYVDGVDVVPQVRAVLAQMRSFVERLHDGAWRGATGATIADVVNIGIGGSDLGPAMVCEALRPFHRPGLRVHFVSNIDGAHLATALAGLDPARTLFIVASKTFTTQETLCNAHSARLWLQAALGPDAVRHHFVALSTHRAAVEAFGIDPANMFAFWDWVGGRYSLWSAIGLSIACAVGMDAFDALRGGAHEADVHLREAPLAANIPVLMALLGLWNHNFLGAAAHAVLPYDQSLARLPAWLQQTDMESNGKRSARDGSPVAWGTGPVVFGEPGTNGQHAFYQLIHQGTPLVACDFIAPAVSLHPAPAGHPMGDPHTLLLANFLAQPQALMLGRSADEVRALGRAAGRDEATVERLLPHQTFPGDRPSSTILFHKLTPFALGRLLALYEHKVLVQGVLWDVFSFDQWGVELGKQLAGPVAAALRGGSAAGLDASTAGLIAAARALRGDA